MSSSSLLKPEDRVLSTLNADGSRRWMKPCPAPGRFHNRRRFVGYALIALFTVLPHLRIGGNPPILLDIARREFHFFGSTLYPTDTLLLAILFVTIFLSIFFLTALFGRVWCGWACPQTVYLELIYRPIERFFEGTPGRKAKVGAWRKPARIAAYVLVSLILAHTFVAYFIPTDRLFGYITESPVSHPIPFVVVMAVTGLMLFDFGFFREQTCIVACPYGRFQSVMLDENSLIISYDRKRGEPRGKARKAPKGATDDVALPVVGDCVDCRKCVTCCPTGIDIREGLQLECINCAQCIDACDSVMDKLGRDRGLIGYHTQTALDGGKHRTARPRVIAYGILISLLVTAFVTLLVLRAPAYVTVLRGLGNPFTTLEDGTVANSLRVRLQDRTPDGGRYTITPIGIEGARVLSDAFPLEVEPRVYRTENIMVAVPPDALTAGRAYVTLQFENEEGWTKDIRYRIVGPVTPAVNRVPPVPPAPAGTTPAESTDGH